MEMSWPGGVAGGEDGLLGDSGSAINYSCHRKEILEIRKALARPKICRIFDEI
jgi:hypothetical protein